MRFVLERDVRLQQAVVRFLQEVVGELAVAADTREIAAEGTGGAIVERAERIFVHRERYVSLGSVGIEAPDVETRHVSHGSPEPARRGASTRSASKEDTRERPRQG